MNGFIPVGAGRIRNLVSRCCAADPLLNFNNIVQYIEDSVPSLLYAYHISTKYNIDRYNKHFDKYNEDVKKTIRNPLLIDSGGFDVNTGKFDRKKTFKLYDAYYDYLENYKNNYDQAFVLDLCPGENTIAFNNWGEVEKINNDSYNRCAILNQEEKNNYIFVFHMASNRVEKIWSALLDEYFDKYNYFGIGGLAGTSQSSMGRSLKVSLGLYKTLKKCVESGRKVLNFHFLGIGVNNYVLLFELFKKHIKEIHGIDVNITYDSSVVFSQLTKNKTLNYFDMDDELFHRVKMKPRELHLKFKDKGIGSELICDVINKFSRKYNLRPDIKNIYDSKNKSETSAYQVLSVLRYFESFKDIANYCKKSIDNIYDFYKAGDYENFIDAYATVNKNLNYNNKKTYVIEKNLNTMLNSLKLLIDFDDNYYKYFIGKSDVIFNNLDKYILDI